MVGTLIRDGVETKWDSEVAETIEAAEAIFQNARTWGSLGVATLPSGEVTTTKEFIKEAERIEMIRPLAGG